ncbi:MAG: EamA family transporter [Candidatus Obscuribacterales bacterium]|nr:EamA family transporter [Candidatus Obscuribacterales bacterium]
MDDLEKKEPTLWQIVFAFAVLYIVWGSTYIAIKFAIHTIPPFMMGGIRFIIAGGLVYIVGMILGHKHPQLIHWRSAAIVGFLLLALGNGGVLIATHHIPSGVVSLMVAMTPVYMSLFADLGKRLPTTSTIIGLILGTIGVACLIGPDGFKGNVSWIGLVAVSVASLSWSAGSIYSRHAPLAATTTMSIASQMICGGVAMAAISLCIGEHNQFDPSLISAKSIWSTIYLILFGSLAGYSAYFWLLKNVSPSKVATYAYVNPIVAVFLGWMLAGEPVTPNIFLAGTIIVAAVWFITKSAKK